MRLYLDTSALVKLVRTEAESDALRKYLRRQRRDGFVTSALARTELVRAALPGGAAAVAHARRLLSGIDQIRVDVRVLDDAATLLSPSRLRSPDAIHLASARRIGADLREIVTYDERLAQAAAAIGLSTRAPIDI